MHRLVLSSTNEIDLLCRQLSIAMLWIYPHYPCDLQCFTFMTLRTHCIVLLIYIFLSNKGMKSLCGKGSMSKYMFMPTVVNMLSTVVKR